LKRAASEEPADALASVRHALELELEPTSYDAQLALCIMLEANHDAAAAIAACTTVLANHPDESYALAARGRAFTETGDHASAKRDLDAACEAGKKSACTASP
jgi:tetratricopeptide (TPR) repeat protein